MERREAFRKIGLGLAVTGLVVALLSAVPSVSPKGSFPWAIIVGTFFYLPGAFLLVFGTKGDERKAALSSLRFIRLGFVAVFAYVVFQMVSG